MKVEELKGGKLNFWVAKAQGKEVYIHGEHCFLRAKDRDYRHPMGNYSPSSDWSQGGPILEREAISVERTDRNPAKWMAIKPHETSNFREDYYYGHGSTYLEAAMRCYVRSKFGHEVDDSQADHI